MLVFPDEAHGAPLPTKATNVALNGCVGATIHALTLYRFFTPVPSLQNGQFEALPMDKKKSPTITPRPGTVRTGGRTERVRQQVAQAVLEIIRSGNFHFDIKDIVERTGINKTTIYRRWPTRQALINEAFREHNSRIQVVDTGHWRSDLLCLARVLRSFLSDPTEIAFNAALAISSDPLLIRGAHESWLPVQEQLEQVVKRAKVRGECRDDLDSRLVTLMLVSPLLVMTLLEKTCPSDEQVTQVVEFLSAGLTATADKPLQLQVASF